MSIRLDAIRNCLDGAFPATIATVATDGTPNVASLSQVNYVDSDHVALSYQFFTKTRENIGAHPYALVEVRDPDTAVAYRLDLEFLRSESAGPLFASMQAKLAGIASHTGMGKVFALKAADIYRVRGIESVPGHALPDALLRPSLLPALRHACRQLAACGDLGGLVEVCLQTLRTQFGFEHAMLLVLDRERERLYTVASCGYADSGVGSEIPLGAGVIGVAARERTAIRITHWAEAYACTRALRQRLEEAGAVDELEERIPFPGLARPGSQLAVPMVWGDALLGVVYVETPEDGRFGYEDEDALATLAEYLALAMSLLQLRAEQPDERAAAPGPVAGGDGVPVILRHFPVNDSVFIGADYLIKGVAGSIFWKLVSTYTRHGRNEFSNRELRLDPSLRLPDVSDNLEARLILLQRRLTERCDFLRIEKTGRGRFRLHVGRPIQLLETPADTGRGSTGD